MLTKCIFHKGFRGMRRSEVRFSFSCNLTGNHPQSLMGTCAQPLAARLRTILQTTKFNNI